MSDPIHVALASDEAGAEGLVVAGHSALSRSTSPMRLWIIENNIDEKTQSRLRASWAPLEACDGVEFISQKTLPIPLPHWWTRARWPLTSAARFQLADILPADAHRCIYLDIDIIVGADLTELFNLDLAGSPVGMVVNSGMPEPDREYVARMGLDPDRYCNAGVLLIDLDAWRKEKAGAGLIEIGRRLPADLWFFDQDMLNCYFKDRCLLLPERWNFRNAGVEADGVVQHFAGSPKPWQIPPERATSVGFAAWHRIRAATGFKATPPSRLAQWKRQIDIRLAQVQRRIVRAFS